MPFDFGTALVHVRGDTKPLEADVTRGATAAGNKAGDLFGAAFSKNALRAGSALTAGLAAGLSQLDNSARQYQATVGASAAETERAKAAAMDLFKVNRAGFDDILGLMATLRTDQNLTEEQTNRLAQSYLTWSKVAGGTAVDAAKSFDDVLDVWNLTAEDGVGIMDKLVASNQKYGGSLQQRVADLHALGPALQALNLTIDDAIGLENLFETAGLDAGSAQRALNTAVKNLKPGQSFDDLIAEISAIEDPTLRAQKAMEIFGARAGTQLATAFQPGITSLKDFGVSAEEAAGKTAKAGADIDASVPHQFELFLHNLGGTLMELAGPAGPILLTFASVAQLATSIGGLRAAFDALKLSATEGWLAVLGPIAILTAAGIALKGVYDEAAAAGRKLATEGGGGLDALNNRLAEYNRQLTILNNAHHSGAISTEQFNAEVAKLRTNYGAVAVAADKSTAETRLQAVALRQAHDASKMHGDAIVRLTGVTGKNTAATGGNTNAQNELFAGLVETGISAQATGFFLAQEAAANDIARQAANAAIGPLSAEAAALDHVAFSAAVAARNLAAMGSAAVAADRANRARLRAMGEAPGAGVAGGLVGGGGPTVVPFDITVRPFDPGLPGIDPVKRGGGGGGASAAETKAHREATAAAQEQASTLKDKLGAALARVKEDTLSYFAANHDANLKAIKDARDRTQVEIDSARERIRAHLDEVRATAEAPVTAAEQAQAAIENERRLRDLNESLAAAQAGGDAIAIRNAQEALQSFQAQQAIAAMRATAQATIATAETEATAAEAALKQREADADKLVATQTAAEDARYETQKKNFERSYDALVAKYENEKAVHKNQQESILKLLGKYGVDYEKAGELLGKSFSKGLGKAVADAEDVAESFAAAVAKYLKLKSPAEAGPLSEPANQWGAKFIDDWLGGAVTRARAGVRDLADVAGGMATAWRPTAPSYGGAERWSDDAAGGARGGQTFYITNPAPEPASRSVVDAMKLASAFPR